MTTLHICNTFFEMELESSKEARGPQSKNSLISQFRLNPIVLQLQFLPLMYAGKDDVILVSDLPENPDPRLQLLSETKIKGEIDHWGPSLFIGQWAKSREIPYSIPNWDMVCEINSKIFSYGKSFKLPGSALLYNKKEALFWIEKTPHLKVMKTAFGFSGKGHFHFDKGRDLDSYLEREFSRNRPVIGEPWVERVFDFSTQWHLSPGKIEFLGSTMLENRKNGTYLATVIGESFEKFQWALEEHLSAAYPLLEEILSLGFFGFLGIDAFVYLNEGKEKLHPIVEINGRKTMGWLALQIERKECPGKVLRLSFERLSVGPLPTKIYVEEKEKEFISNIRLVKN